MVFEYEYIELIQYSSILNWNKEHAVLSKIICLCISELAHKHCPQVDNQYGLIKKVSQNRLPSNPIEIVL